jgi:hypothetical protein
MLRRPAALCVDRLPNELRGATQNCTTSPIVSAVSASIYLQAHSLPRRLTQMPSSHKRGPTAGMVRVTRHCSRCQNPRVAAAYPARQLGSAAKPEMDPIAAACDLVGALAADDVTSANHALPHTSALHVAVAANVLAPSGPTSDLQELLQLLGLQAEIDAIGAAGHPRRARKLMTGRGHGYRRPRHVLDLQVRDRADATAGPSSVSPRSQVWPAKHDSRPTVRRNSSPPV